MVQMGPPRYRGPRIRRNEGASPSSTHTLMSSACFPVSFRDYAHHTPDLNTQVESAWNVAWHPQIEGLKPIWRDDQFDGARLRSSRHIRKLASPMCSLGKFCTAKEIMPFAKSDGRSTFSVFFSSLFILLVEPCRLSFQQVSRVRVERLLETTDLSEYGGR